MIARYTSLCFTAALFVFSFMISSSLYGQALDKPEKIDKLFQEGVDHYKSGNYIQAAQSFEMILTLDPSSEIAAKLRREAGEALFVKMIRIEEMRLPAMRLFKLAYQWEKQLRRSPELIQRFIVDLFQTDPERRARGMFQLFGTGHFAIPYLVKYLNDEMLELSMRTTAKLTIQKMGRESVLSLIELLDSKSNLLLENSALILGSIKDKRALAALMRAWESNETPPVAKKYIALAIKEITGNEASELATAKDLYYENARRYLLNGPAVEDEARLMEGVVWKYRDGDTLVGLNIMNEGEGEYDYVPAVPIYSWNEYMAEENCYDAMNIDRSFDKTFPLLVCVYYAQLNEVHQLLKNANVLLENGVISEKDKEQLLMRKERMKRAELIGRLVGRNYLYKALNVALNDKLPNVAVSIIHALKDVADGSLLEPLKPVKKSKKGKKAKSKSRTDKKAVVANIKNTEEKSATKKEDVAPTKAATPKKEVAKKETDKEIVVAKADTKTDKKEETKASKKLSRKERKRRDKAEKKKKKELKKQESKKSVVAKKKKDAKKEKTRKADKKKALAKKKKEKKARETMTAGTPLSLALVDTDDRVAYESAITCAKLNHETLYLNSDMVCKVLAKAVGEKGTLSILVVDDNTQQNNTLCSHLRQLGFMVISATSGVEGKYLGQTPPVKDVILVASHLKDRMAERLIVDLKTDFRTRYSPVGIVSEPKHKETDIKRFDGVSSFFFTLPESDDSLREKIRQLAESTENILFTKEDKQVISARAAEALAAIDVKHTVLQIEDAIPSLIQALDDNRIDLIRNPVLQALAHFKAKAALPAIIRTFKNDTNDKEVRLNCLRAIGDINPTETEAYKTLSAAINEPDYDINTEAAIALGKAALTPAQINERLKDQRIVKDLK